MYMKSSLKLFIFFFVIIIFSCNNSPVSSDINSKNATSNPIVEAPKMVGHYPEWSKNANMYEVNIRQFTPEGSFASFTKHIPRLKEMGVDILWLMPIYPISDTKKKGTLGSYYAISDYAKVNPEFGTLEEFRTMVKAVHDADMKIILDFVPNHTGWDHTWISEHPDYFTQDKDGNIIDPIDPSTGESWGWTDVADLNFDNVEMRKDMINDMHYWIKKEAIDGYRMDVAHGVPVEFWAEVSTALTNVKPDIFMLAESEVTDLRNKKYFQTDYGWEFHHILNDIAKGEKGPKDVKHWLEENQKNYDHGWHIQFTSNHDENSWAGSTKERMGEAHDALAALAFTLDGMPLIYGGQEEPLQRKLEFFEKDDIGFGKYEKADWYKKILALKHKNQSLWNGEFGGNVEFLTVDDQILAYQREKNGMSTVCILNLSDKPGIFEAPMDFKNLKNVFSQQNTQIKKNAKINLSAWDYRIFSSN